MSDILTREQALAHFGVKGMKWGVRKERTPAQKAATRRKVKRAAKVTAVAVGTAAAVYVLSNNKNISVNQIRPQATDLFEGLTPRVNAARANFSVAPGSVRPRATPMPSGPIGRANAGKAATQNFGRDVWKKNVNDILADINSAHEAQTRFMRTQGNYNPRSNPFTPESRRLAIGR